MHTIHRIWDLADDMVARHNEQAEALAEFLTLLRRVAPDERPAALPTLDELRTRPCLLCLLGTVDHAC